MNQIDIGNRLERLSEPQREALRMVARFMTSKQIARELGITHHAVDARLKRAVTTMGVATRTDAVRLFIEHHQQTVRSTYQQSAYGSTDLPEPSGIRNQGVSADEWSPKVDNGRTELRESQDFNFDLPVPRFDQPPFLSTLFGVNRENKLSAGKRLAIVLLIMFFGIFALGTLINVLEVTTRLIATTS